MINARTLDILLRTLEGDAGLGPRAPARVAALGATSAVGSRLQRPAATVALDAPLASRANDLQDVVQANDINADAAATRSAAPRPQANDANTDVMSTALRPAQASVVDIAARRPPGMDTIDPSSQPIADAGAPLHLSGAAKFVDQLVRQSDATVPATVVRGTQPLAESGAVVPDVLARALQSQLAQSGLFYESHLAQWALQNYSVADLAHEPQAAMVADASDAMPDAMALSTSARPDVATANAFQDAAALPLVRHQLDTLERRQVAWEGQVWPGQSARIQITEEGASAAQDVAAWRTRLALDLPNLGPVEATLSLRGNTLRLQLNVAATESMSALRATHGDLADALGQRALSLIEFAVEHGHLD
jgi:Flagellar hook-length control protein FliK